MITIGLQLNGKQDRISAAAFITSLNAFHALITDVDRVVSQRRNGGVFWELGALRRNSPAIIEFAGIARPKAGPLYADAVQLSILDGIDHLAEVPEQPEGYSYSALKSVRTLADQATKSNTKLAGTEAAPVLPARKKSDPGAYHPDLRRSAHPDDRRPPGPAGAGTRGPHATPHNREG